ncbi:hypothetical protein BVC71_04930 [Marivivens niveibacter]|uniref:MobA-like NTP transferase domain-containing protein n=1 Tax=Marivivens niveibacter TaxID=1930667 RepID=A0A251X3U5_9RHOB|nr:nucleotidyltransferase family protein [Marivivens niveibacter]OUD10823.1 hypothetical protein BVC71_04930 [Marivivens niveibacter]
MTAILFPASGLSSRMGGQDKLTREIDGVPILLRQVQRGLETGCSVYVAVPSMDHPRAQLLKGSGANCVLGSKAGLSDTLRMAVAAMPNRDLMICLPDMPDIRAADFTRLIQIRDTNPDYLIWRYGCDGRLGHPILFSSALLRLFRQLSGDHGAAEIVQAHKEQMCVIDQDDERYLRDLDTMDDWLRYEKSRR